MTKDIGLSVAIALFGAVAATPASASAVRRVHRPWLLVHSRSRHSPVHAEAVTRPPPPVMAPAPSPVVPVSPDLETRDSAPGNQIAEQATRYQGTRYRWGGANKHGIDCSGLVLRVFEDLKLRQLPHASSALFNAGQPVATSELRPGDLVFFKNTYRRGISHVGVYAGHNKFVHAADHRHGVIMTALSDPYYQLHYAGARRLY